MFRKMLACLPLRGPTHFKGVILYLWNDPGEIKTAYVKLKKKLFVRENFFILKKLGFLC